MVDAEQELRARDGQQVASSKRRAGR